MSGRQRQRVNTAKNERNGVHVMYRNDEGTVTVRELDAITWAAKNAGVSYFPRGTRVNRSTHKKIGE